MASVTRYIEQAAVLGFLFLWLALGPIIEGATPAEATNNGDVKVFPDVNSSKLDIFQKILPAKLVGDTTADGPRLTTAGKHTGLDNILSDHPSRHWQGCSKMENQVLCTGIDVTSIPDDLGPGTTFISFARTGLSELPNDAFLNYPDLETIIVASSPLEKVDARAFYGISNLRKLVLGYNNNKNITFENITFMGISSLKSLQLVELNLQELPKYLLENATSLQKMDLRFNRITNITEDALLSTLDNLNELDMSSNMIDFIPPSAFNHFPNISSLILAGNSLESFDVAIIEQLNNLASLDVSGNRISSLNGHICNSSTTLTYLDLGNNALTGSTLNGSFTGCTSVKTLDISNNGIDSLAPETFIDMTELADLRIGHNNLQSIPSNAIGNISALKALDISGNNITTIGKDDMEALENLEMLKAKRMKNQLTIEEGAFKGGLLVLDLSSNYGINVSMNTLLSPSNIQKIILYNCGIKTLDGDSIMNKTSLTKLDISSNPLICDCHIAWMAEARQVGKPWALDWNVGTIPPACTTPTWKPYFSLDITDLNKDDLTCDKPVVKPLTPTNITVSGELTFVMKAYMTKGFPYSTWIFPDGQRARVRHGAPPLKYKLGQIVCEDIDVTNHIVTTTAYITYGFDYTDPVNFTLVASNLAGDTAITFWVTLNSKPPNGVSHEPAFDIISFILVMTTTLLLRD